MEYREVPDIHDDYEQLLQEEYLRAFEMPVRSYREWLADAKEKERIRDAAWFVYLFRPFLNRYTVHRYLGDCTTWITLQARLTLESIQKAIDGSIVLGWYSSIATPVIGIDIDDHDQGGWKPGLRDPLPSLQEAYLSVRERFPHPPSMTVLSPHGLHLYYLLSRPLHADNLRLLTRSLIGDSSIELKPTPRTTLRVPSRKWMLDPDSLQRLYTQSNHRTPWSEIRIYQMEEIFGGLWRTRLRDLSHRSSATTTKRYWSGFTKTSTKSDIPSLEEVEATHLPLKNSQTYRQIFHLVVACRREGFGVDQTIDRVKWWLEHSPDYSGALTKDPAEIERRVAHIFKVPIKSRAPRPLDINEYDEIITQIVAAHPFVKQRTKGVRKFLYELARWKKRHDMIFANKEYLRLEDDKHEFYRLNRSKGLYPLPSKVLKQWNTNYPSLLSWLLEIGVLSESGATYSPHRHVCKYYFVSFDQADLSIHTETT